MSQRLAFSDPYVVLCGNSREDSLGDSRGDSLGEILVELHIEILFEVLMEIFMETFVFFSSPDLRTHVLATNCQLFPTRPSRSRMMRSLPAESIADS